jgi:hypothetical protein
MDSTTSNVLVPLFFIHGTVGTGLLAAWFANSKQQSLRDFGWGMVGYALGMAFWTAAVLAKPGDPKPLILAGVVPFLLAHIAFAKAASVKLPTKTSTLVGLTIVLLVATFVARTFFYESEPYFSDKGLLYFGLRSVPVALYIATISVSFLPAIRVVVADMKDKSLKTVMGIGLTTLYVNAIILVSAKDDTLLLINGVVLTLALLALWAKALGTPRKA